MIVEIENCLEGCPDECPYAKIGVDEDVMSGIGGAAKVVVTVFCDHQSVCAHRRNRGIRA